MVNFTNIIAYGTPPDRLQRLRLAIRDRQLTDAIEIIQGAGYQDTAIAFLLAYTQGACDAKICSAELPTSARGEAA